MFFRLSKITQDRLKFFITVTSAACLGHAHSAISAHWGKDEVLRILVQFREEYARQPSRSAACDIVLELVCN